MSTARKRKSDATDASQSTISFAKKSRKSNASDAPTGNHLDETARKLVKDVLDNEDSFEEVVDVEPARDTILQLANYARSLERLLQAAQSKALVAADVNASKAAAAPAKLQKTKAQIEVEVDKLRRTASSGISKQMSWRPSCKTGSAKWAYDGLCADPLVFGALLGLDGAPTFKMKKFPVMEFEDCLGGSITKSVRYDVLSITGNDVNVRWNPETGEFKFSGSYGK